MADSESLHATRGFHCEGGLVSNLKEFCKENLFFILSELQRHTKCQSVMSDIVKVCLLTAEARFTVTSLTLLNGSSNWLRISPSVHLIGQRKRAITSSLRDKTCD